MKIGMFIASYFPDQTGGAEQQCRRLSEELVRQGHSVTILTTRARRDSPRDAIENGVRVIRMPRIEALLGRRSKPAVGKSDSGKTPPAAALSPSRCSCVAAWIVKRLNLWLMLGGTAWRMCRLRDQVDIWHVHVAALTAGWCAWWARRAGVPVVCKGANLPVFSNESGIPFRRTMIESRRRLYFIALTPEMKADLAANGVDEKRIAVIPNGIAMPTREPRPDPGANGVVLYVANLTRPVENKAFDVLFDAWARVHEHRPAAKLVVAGAGDSGVWQKFLRVRGAEASVHFAGRVSDLSPLYRNALMLLLPSRREGISNALLEAQSWGVPAVVSAIPGNEYVVRDGENGVVVPVGDTDALATGILRLLDDPLLRAAMSRAAFARIESEFQMEAIAKRVVRFYGEAGAKSA